MLSAALLTSSVFLPRPRLAQMAASSSGAAELRAACFCGAVSLSVDTAQAPISSSICHCETCRRLSGAPMMATVMYPKGAVTVSARETLSETRTSKHVKRLRCPACSSPVLAELGGERVGVPLSLFARPLPAGWDPQCHLWCGHPPCLPYHSGPLVLPCIPPPARRRDTHHKRAARHGARPDTARYWLGAGDPPTARPRPARAGTASA